MPGSENSTDGSEKTKPMSVRECASGERSQPSVEFSEPGTMVRPHDLSDFSYGQVRPSSLMSATVQAPPVTLSAARLYRAGMMPSPILHSAAEKRERPRPSANASGRSGAGRRFVCDRRLPSCHLSNAIDIKQIDLLTNRTSQTPGHKNCCKALLNCVF